MRTLPRVLLLAVILLAVATPQAHAEDEGKVMDLAFENAPIGKVLQELARLSGRNVVIAPDVQGTATVKLANVDWRRAFELLADAYALDVQHKAGTITIVRKAAPSDAQRKRALTKEIAASKARIAEIEREIEAHAARRGGARMQAEAEKLRRALEATRKEHAGRKAEADGAIAAQRARLATVRKDLARVEAESLRLREASRRIVENNKDLRKAYEALAPHGGIKIKRREPRRRAVGDATAKAEAALAAGHKRIENLARALEHLQQAGLRPEAERVAKHLEVAKREQIVLRARLAAAAKERAAARHHARSAAQGGLDGVRAEVRALRAEVRNLTVLVKKLLELHGADAKRAKKKAAGKKHVW